MGLPGELHLLREIWPDCKPAHLNLSSRHQASTERSGFLRNLGAPPLTSAQLAAPAQELGEE